MDAASNHSDAFGLAGVNATIVFGLAFNNIAATSLGSASAPVFAFASNDGGGQEGPGGGHAGGGGGGPNCAYMGGGPGGGNIMGGAGAGASACAGPLPCGYGGGGGWHAADSLFGCLGRNSTLGFTLGRVSSTGN